MRNSSIHGARSSGIRCVSRPFSAEYQNNRVTPRPASPPTLECKRQVYPSSPSPAGIPVPWSPGPQYELCTPPSEPPAAPWPPTGHPLDSLPFFSAGGCHPTPRPLRDRVLQKYGFVRAAPETGLESCRRGVGICSSGDAVATRLPVRNSTGSLSSCTAHVGTSISLIWDDGLFLGADSM